LRSKTELIFFSGCRYSLTVVKQSCFNGESLKSLTTMWQAVREITNFRLCVTVLLTVALVTHTRLWLNKNDSGTSLQFYNNVLPK